MEKEKILEEYFLDEIPSSTEMIGWRVIGEIENPKSNSADTYLELKTKMDGWLCEFQIKILKCGLVLVSPECVMREEDHVMEAAEKVFNPEEEQTGLENWYVNYKTITNTPPYINTWTTTDSNSRIITYDATNITC